MSVQPRIQLEFDNQHCGACTITLPRHKEEDEDLGRLPLQLFCPSAQHLSDTQLLHWSWEILEFLLFLR